jgi:hypothetical protein
MDSPKRRWNVDFLHRSVIHKLLLTEICVVTMQLVGHTGVVRVACISFKQAHPARAALTALVDNLPLFIMYYMHIELRLHKVYYTEQEPGA